jgi:hypothetical protein
MIPALLAACAVLAAGSPCPDPSDQWVLWGNGHPAVTTGTSTPCTSDSSYAQCQAVCDGASDCTSFWWTMEYSNGRCCTKSAFVDDLSTMIHQNNADEDVDHGFYTCVTPDTTCTSSSGSAGQWTLWGNGHPAVTTGTSTPCTSDSSYAQCQAVCNGASDCTSFWWTKEYSNGRCCTKSAFVDDLSTMIHQNNADEDVSHGFYTCAVPTPLCSVSCAINNRMVKVTHDTTTSHTQHRCYLSDGNDVTSDCICSCCNGASNDCAQESSWEI